ncbi:MAG TPA: hypothetical protein VH189_04060 [Rhizomicrobium sp.]|nr:hypothetical protein [Rhizomicrobium sp.]
MTYRLSLGIAFGLLLFSKTAMAACTVPNPNFMSGTTISSSQVNANFAALAGCASVPTRQVLTSGTSATYTTPANVRQLRIRMVGGGGGGGGVAVSAFGSSGNNGSATSFGTFTANGGSGGFPYSVALGGSGGSCTASFRIRGGQGSGGGIYAPPNPVQTQITSLAGGQSPFGGAGGGQVGTGASGGDAAVNSGSGGGGATYSDSMGTGHYSVWNGSGAAGEYAEIIINSPSATYTYTVGAGGTGGTGTSANGGNGATGLIIVDEYY